MLMPAWLIALAALLLFALGWVWHARCRWQRDSQALLTHLTDDHASATVTRYAPHQLDTLPAPVARYLRQVLREGQSLVGRVLIRWRGEFNMGRPGVQRWKPFSAEQTYAVQPPGFVWEARIAMLPGLAVWVRDGFVAGAGSMRAAVSGLFTVVDKGGDAGIAVAALQRHLAETLWFPTALLPGQGVMWQPVDDTCALARLSAGGVTATLEFHFGADGLVQEVFAAERWYDDGKQAPQPLPWRARILSWQAHAGQQVPAEAVVEWLFPHAPHAYWRGAPTAIDYDVKPS